ncbi:putative ribonuclease H-like domain-containing protein [Rosa chinensis]|uniref:Putative ribonuclease H-like domain-containing protein n=1 Tax=Rosa chinensis TaxID=74649 RepID=A0A2P6PU71_ROSCH|nr:putative ribonuclease H-like domain-containing protein [Rosa chinensis]
MKHIEQIYKGYLGRADLANGQIVLGSDGLDDPTVVVRHWSKEVCTKAATVMVVMDKLPFSAVERPGFKYFCSVAVPKWKMPCRKVIVKNFLRMYASKKEELKRELAGHCVCLTTDTWTSVQNINYMVLTAHLIDNGWKTLRGSLIFV